MILHHTSFTSYHNISVYNKAAVHFPGRRYSRRAAEFRFGQARPVQQVPSIQSPKIQSPKPETLNPKTLDDARPASQKAGQPADSSMEASSDLRCLSYLRRATEQNLKPQHLKSKTHEKPQVLHTSVLSEGVFGAPKAEVC